MFVLDEIKAKPFLKWPGGKSQLLDDILPLVDGAIGNDGSFIYVEPFVGGGAMLFEVLSKYGDRIDCAVINDLNSDLINCYKVIQDDSDFIRLKELLKDYESRYNVSPDKKSFYLELRTSWNSDRNVKSKAEMAAMFISLNKLCFNGIWRVNSKGEFNVPWNQCNSVKLFDEENLDNCHRLLSKVIILSGDFELTDVAFTLSDILSTDVVFYFDPPYRPVSKTSSFTGYTKECFDDSQQERLKLFCDRINAKNFAFVLSNSKSEDYFEELYRDYNIRYVKARRSINSVGEGRGKVDELLIANRNVPSTFALF